MVAAYLIIYDLGRPSAKVRQRINRALRRLGAAKLQQSVWESDNLAGLKLLAKCIEKARGRAMVLRKDVVQEEEDASEEISEMVGWNLFTRD
ncbi:MAG: hypothetical protein ACK4GQ_05020 [Candidatus Hadarchaeales archaeon]